MISPVLHFSGDCEEAIHLYEKAFTVTEKQIDYYRDAPENNNMHITEDMLDMVMHSTLNICGTQFNMSDTLDEVTQGNRICFNVFVDSEAEVKKAYDVLSVEGQIIYEMREEFFAKLYTTIVDKYGIRWQIVYIQ